MLRLLLVITVVVAAIIAAITLTGGDLSEVATEALEGTEKVSDEVEVAADIEDATNDEVTADVTELKSAEPTSRAADDAAALADAFQNTTAPEATTEPQAEEGTAPLGEELTAAAEVVEDNAGDVTEAVSDEVAAGKAEVTEKAADVTDSVTETVNEEPMLDELEEGLADLEEDAKAAASGSDEAPTDQASDEEETE